MVKWSSIALIAISIVHMIVLGADVPFEVPKWSTLNLWTFEHWRPLRSQPIDLALSGGVFWSTVGSFAIPLLVLGALIFWLDRHCQAIPPFVGWCLVAWTGLASLIMAPSGFPVALAIAVVLAIGIQRKARSAERPA
ncbi:MAG: hypothetical protein H0T56_10700 [Pseudaminobacter sp.]|nr:hypothetical protein [Pseudaminobacter sp.]